MTVFRRPSATSPGWVEAAPTLLLHGTADNTVPYQQSVDMMRKLKQAGVPAEISSAEGALHGFFNRPPWHEPTLKRMEEFFLRFLAKPRS